MPVFAVNGPWRLGPALAIGLGCVAALGAAASFVFGQISADWLRFSLVAQVVVVVALATVLVRQIAALRRTQGSLVTANADLAGAQASLETNNRMLRATQAELKRARQQLMDGIEGSSDGFALYDAEDRLVVCNSRYSKLFGLHPDLLRPGTSFVDILRAHVSAGRVAAAVGREDEWIAARLAQHRDPQGLFERNIDGHWFRFSDRPTSEGGTVTIFTQIDELKQREQRLRDNQSILQSILDHIPVTVSITDRERRIVLLNRRIEDLYGVHQADVIGRPIDEVRPRRYSGDSAARDHFRVVETGEPILGRQDDYGRGPDVESWITNVAPIKGEDGSVRYVLRSTFEVPQLAAANRELADYRAFLIEAERQAKIASWHQDPQGDNRTIWSENVEAVVGYPSAQIDDDATFLAVVHPEDRERIAGLFRAVDEHPGSYDAEYRVIRRDGRTIWVRGITRAEFDEAGSLVRYIGSIQDITEGKRAEQALRDSEAVLKEAQRRARLAYWLWDPDAGRYVLAAEAAEILGLPVSDLATNDHFLPYIHEDDRAWVAEAFLGQTERLEPCVIEYRWRRPDGRVIWLRDMCEQERDSTGRVRRLVGTIQDVTEQKRSEEALRENQALLLAAQRRARIAYWLEDIGSGRGYTTSDFMAEVLGVPADAVPTTDGDYVKIVHPEDRARVAHAYERAVAGMAPYALEYRLFRPDGSIGWVRELAEFQIGPAGRPVRIIGTIQDITEQKSIETALRDSEARMRAFMDHAPVAMFVKDLDGRFTMLNRHDAVFLGQAPEDAIGRRAVDFMASDDAALVEAHDRAVLAAGQPVERELHFSNRSHIEWSYEVKFPVRDAAGAIVAMGGVALDVSAQKRMEQALRHSEELLREVIFVSNIGIFDHDHRVDTITWSAEQRKNYGFDADEVVTLPKFVECVHPEDRDWVFAAVSRAHDPAGDGRFDVEHRIIRRDGAVRWLDTRSQTFFAGEGDARRPLRTIGAVIDITDRKNAELALKESEARLRRAQLQAKLVCWSWDLAAGSYFWAPGSGLALGFPDDELPFDLAGYAAIVHPEDRDALRRLYAEVEASRDAYKLEYRILQPGGEAIWVEEIAAVERDASGRRLSVSGTLQDVTERKRADAALRDSEVRMRAFMDNAPVGMFVKDLDGRFTMLNRHDAGFFGRQPEDIVGHRSADFLASDDAAMVEAHDRSVLAAGVPVERELHFVNRPRIEWSYEVKFPIRDAGGAVVAMGGVAVDITTLKRTEQALRDSEARMRAFMDHAPMLIYLKDIEGRYQLINREFERVEGVSEVQLRGKTVFDVLPREHAELFAASDREIMALGQMVARENHDPARVIYRDSLAVKFPVRDGSGRVVGIGGFTQDITERKRAENALRESEARLRRAQLQAKLACWSWDLDTDSYVWAPGSGQALGLAETALPVDNTDYRAAVHPEDRDALWRLYAEVEAGRDAFTAEFRILRPDGEIIWVEEIGEVERDADGRRFSVSGTLQDVSERKRAEAALRDSEARLRGFLDHAPFAMYLKDTDLRYLLVNRVVEQFQGMTDAEICGKTPEQVYPPALAERFIAEDREVLARGVPVTFEYSDRTLSSYADSLSVRFPVRDSGGRIVAIGGITQDISERKRAERALRDSEARLKDAQRRARLAYWSWDPIAREYVFGEEYCEIIGVATPDEVQTDDQYLQFVHEADRDRVAAGLRRQRDDLEPGVLEYRVRRPDGRVVWLRDSCERVPDATSGGVRLVGTVQDVTEQKQVELALAESEARLRGLLDNAPFTIYLRDTQHRYLLVNREIERFTGKTASEICGKTPEDIYPPEQAREYIEHDRAVLELGAPITVESSYPASASYAESVAVRFPVRDSTGRIVAIGGITQDITGRKQAERALRESEARMRSFMDNAPVAVAIMDLERRFVLLNNRIELAFGRPARDIIGRRTIELSASAGAAAVDALEREVIETGNVAMAEVFFPERSALPWTFEVKFPIRDAAGTMVAIGGVAIDITDRKKAELALAESEARFRSFMDNAPFDMVVKDLQGRYLMVNRGVETAWHLATAEILGRTLPELSHSDGVAQVEAIEREVMEAGHIVAREVHFTDLGPEWTYEVKFPIRDASGSIVALGGVAIDISDRKKAQMELAESEARLRRAQQQARLAYWSWQFAGDSTAEEYRWSPGSGLLLGMPDADMPRNDGESMSLTMPEDRERLRRLYDETRAGLDNYTVEYRVRRPDGVVVWVREIAEVVRDAEGRRVGVEGTMQDITDQRALEEQLRQAQKMESIGQLTGGIAHDFNNLMAVILGNLELLAEDLPGNIAAQQKIDTAIRSTLRGSDLTQRLLSFARQQSLAPKLTQIDELIPAMRDLLLRPLGPAITATFALGDGLWPTEIDQARLETSLLNLVINARDAMPDGGKLTIAARNVAIESGDAREVEGLAPGDYVLIAVSDTGEGMPEEVRARAFDPFFTTKGIGRGTGLGLSMVYGFVKQSGGHIELVSEVGRGTTVNIYLPAAKGSAAAAGAPAPRQVDLGRGVREAQDNRGGR